MERREPLQQIIKHTFPAIQSICSNLVNSETIEAAEMLKLALKIYHSGIQVYSRMGGGWKGEGGNSKLIGLGALSGRSSQMLAGDIILGRLGHHVHSAG